MLTRLKSLNRTQIWQFFFLVGIVSCVVSGVIVFGVLLATTTIGLCAIVISVLNALLSPIEPALAKQNWLLAKLKCCLNVSTFLRASTIGIWSFSICLLVYGGIRHYHETRKVTFQGVVVTAGDEPADQATVTLFLTGRQETTQAIGGRFTFPKIDLSDESSTKLRIHAQWRSTKMDETLQMEDTIDFSSGPPANLVLKLPPGTAPFKVTYFFLQGHAIDFLIREQAVDTTIEQVLGGQPLIVPTAVFNKLRFLMNKFSVPFEGDSFEGYYAEQGKQKNILTDAEHDKLVARYAGKPTFVGSWDGQIFGAVLSKKALVSLFQNTYLWNLVLSPEYVNDTATALPTNYFFWKFADQIDAQNVLHGTFLSFYKYVTKDFWPSDFCLLIYKYDSREGICGYEEDVFLFPRRLQLQVATIENISRQPIKIGNFFTRENSSERLRTRDQDQTQLDSGVTNQQTFFPQEMLQPHEKLLLPLKMSFAYRNDYSKGNIMDVILEHLKTSYSSDSRVALTSKLKGFNKIKFDLHYDSKSDGAAVEITPDVLLETLHIPSRSAMLDKEYIFGPSISLEEIEVDKVNFKARKYDPNKIVFHSGLGEGSCPYVYTYSSESGRWINEGHILYGRNGKHKESTDEKELSKFDGRIIIKELEPEVSFIDSVFIKITTLSGKETILRSSNKTLRLQDGNYLKLKQGQSIEVGFQPLPKFDRVQKYTLVTKGYYLPLGIE